MSNDDLAAAARGLEGGHHSNPSRINLVDHALVDGGGSDAWYQPHRGKLANEVPYRGDLVLPAIDHIGERLGPNPARKRVRQACGSLIANVMYAHARAPETWVFYSRDRNHFAAFALARRYVPPFYTLATYHSRRRLFGTSGAHRAPKDPALAFSDLPLADPRQCLASCAARGH